MKILCISDVFYPRRGGTEIIFYELFRRLTKKGFEIDVITPRIKGTEKNELIEGINIKRVPGNRFTFMLPAFKEASKLKTDLIQTAVWFGGYPSGILKMIKRKPSVLMVNAFFGYRWKMLRKSPVSEMFFIAERLLFSLPFDKFVCLSNSQKQALEAIGIKNERTEFTYPGVNKKIFHPINISKKIFNLKDEFVYCFYGRYDSQKGIDILLHVAKKFYKQHKNSKLVLIITGDNRKAIKMIEKLGIKEHIILLPGQSQEKLVKIINVADVLVFPSRAESFGMVAAESAAVGKPVIVSDVDGFNEIIVNGKTGFLIKPNNSDMIVEKLNILYKNKNLRKRMGKNALKRSNLFDWDKMAKQYERIYENLV